ncbi:MAG: type 1 glutamine amidotransferase domain-containing protein [Alphaproteobacteria bacterium]|nr:type 1 glutamine amidotransferase domain-containing protein [Alphaproteobacteria bacterium]
MSKHVLVVLTNHATLAGEPNGTYMPELTHALHVLNEAGLSWALATPKGGAAPGYGHDADALTREMLADKTLSGALADTAALSAVNPADYDAVFYPGGYGLLFDLADDADSQRVAAQIHEQGGVVAAVCHGPAALAGVKLPSGEALIAGRQVTGFTREEEAAMSTLDKIPFLLEQRMIDAGATYQKRKAWQTLVVQDGRVITGQNPGSAKGVGEALAAALG